MKTDPRFKSQLQQEPGIDHIRRSAGRQAMRYTDSIHRKIREEKNPSGPKMSAAHDAINIKKVAEGLGLPVHQVRALAKKNAEERVEIHQKEVDDRIRKRMDKAKAKEIKLNAAAWTMDTRMSPLWTINGKWIG